PFFGNSVKNLANTTDVNTMCTTRRVLSVALLATCTLVSQGVLGSVGAAHAAPVVAPDNKPTPSTYTVVAGDSLWGISLRLKVSLNSLLTVNNLTVESFIFPGQKLVAPPGATIPDATTASPTTTATTAVKASSNGGSTTAGTSSSTYTIVAGDSLWGISQRLNVSFNSLLAANNLTADSFIFPGQNLVAPSGVKFTTPPTSTASRPSETVSTTPSTGKPPTPTPAPTTTQYTVVAGDYLYGIARDFTVPFDALLAANSFTSSSLIIPGMKITIPAGATPKASTNQASISKPAITGPASGGAAATTPTVTTPTATTPTVPPKPPTSALPTTGNVKLDAVLAFAQAQIGKPYVFFTAGPATYDCSGLVKAAYAQAGISLIHQSAVQSTYGTAVDWTTEPIRPGDLVFTYGSGTPGIISHVGIATSDTHWIQATRPGSFVVSTWLPASNKIVAVRRLIPTP
ncbi:MAG: LysM peptidoglycan-binding domain-containing protein, partial [Ilumatobacteraceae bacterium]